MNQPFDVTLTHRLAEQLEQSAKSLKTNVTSPGEVQQHLEKINSIMGSLQSLTQQAGQSGMNPVNDNGDIR
ncbi:hypothetical protein [Aneurinibacillus tyrosinisolvens]|uniref:hypothetical protein n=1 Tax=Aneurinibacillus tyrosinisolvens TaxID=1443435 RepID=UPI00063F6435|nr:hypothetical protein [Aneurinibacillus tyrosinisolvens]